MKWNEKRKQKKKIRKPTSSKPQDDDSPTLCLDTADNYVKYFNENS